MNPRSGIDIERLAAWLECACRIQDGQHTGFISNSSLNMLAFRYRQPARMIFSALRLTRRRM
jgi:hypothetical protein